MSSSNLTLHAKVERILADWLGSIEVDRDGDFTVPVDSTRLFVSMIDQEERTLIKIGAPLVSEVAPSPELYEYLALHAGDLYFGSYEVDAVDTGVSISLYYTLLGDYIDPEELKSACVAIGMAADDADDELQKRFGGNRFIDRRAEVP